VHVDSFSGSPLFRRQWVRRQTIRSNAPLVVDANTVLTLFTLQSLKPFPEEPSESPESVLPPVEQAYALQPA